MSRRAVNAEVSAGVQGRLRVVASAGSLAALLLSALPAAAHPESTQPFVHGGFFIGVLHPLSGIDHLLAAIGAGLWTARQAPAFARRIAPVFAMLLVAGVVVGGMIASAPPLLEVAIALSVVGIGLLLATHARLRPFVGAALLAVVALVHGLAHGREAGTAFWFSYLAGLLCSTLALFLLARMVGARLQRTRRPVSRAIGVAIAAAGGLLLAS